MRLPIASALIVSAVSVVSLPAMAQPVPQTQAAPRAEASDVPVTRVALFSSGVGYFEHFGSVTGDSQTVIRFKADQINDVLKSMVLQDLDGGLVSAVKYPSQDPLGRRLKGFGVDVTAATTLPALLGQLRGAVVTVRFGDTTASGTIFGIESRKRSVGDVAIDAVFLTLVTPTGIRSVPLDDIISLTLTDAALQAELDMALAAVASARHQDKKNVTLDLRGDGDRRVRIGYVVQTPVWKTSYRLVVDEQENTASLQGWAIVENQTDNDWTDIQLSLVSGRPISFVMDLYEPLYLTRPLVRLEMFEGLRPQQYAEGMTADVAPAAPRSRRVGAHLADEPAASESIELRREMRTLGLQPIDPTASVAAQASAGQIGELFEYVIPQVTIPRQSSAMIPIVNDSVQVARLSIYNPAVHARYPLTGARIKNTTDKHLLQGPITVFLGGGYAGDSQINNVGPGQDRLISYGIDLQTLVDSQKQEQRSTIVAGKIVAGSLELSTRQIAWRDYAIQNKGDRDKTVVIEHQKLDGWELVETPKPVEATDDLHRFEVAVGAGKQAALRVTQQMTQLSAVRLIEIDHNQLVYFATNREIPQPVRDALAKAAEMQRDVLRLDEQLQQASGSIAAIHAEQNRIRENMRTVDRTTDFYKRLMNKLDEQETQIEELQKQVEAALAQRNAKRNELETYLANLDIG